MSSIQELLWHSIVVVGSYWFINTSSLCPISFRWYMGDQTCLVVSEIIISITHSHTGRIFWCPDGCSNWRNFKDTTGHAKRSWRRKVQKLDIKLSEDSIALDTLGFQPPWKQWVAKYNHHCLPKGFNHPNWVNHYFDGGGRLGLEYPFFLQRIKVHLLSEVPGVKSVQRVVCGGCLDFKVSSRTENTTEFYPPKGSVL